MVEQIQIKQKIRLIKPHPKQRELIDILDKKGVTYVTVNVGRQWGKTTIAWNWLFSQALRKTNSVGLWVSRWYKQTVKVFSTFEKVFRDCPAIEKFNRSELSITLKNGSQIKFFSAQNHDSIRGETIDFLVCDEMSLFPEAAFYESIQPTLATRKGAKCLMISTPRGKGLWYNLFQNGYDADKRKWRNFTAPSTTSPYIQLDFIADLKLSLPDKIFRQEILAEFIDDAGSVFENIRSNALSIVPVKSSQCYAGIDVAFKNDFTVLTIINDKGEVLDWLRFNDETENYKSAAQRLYNKLKEYNFPHCYIETNKFDSVYSYLKELNTPRIEPFITSTNKSNIIENLMSKFQSNEIKIPKDDYFISEFEAYTYDYDPTTRNVKFGAPEGLHDDIVMATSLAFWKMKSKPGFSWAGKNRNSI